MRGFKDEDESESVCVWLRLRQGGYGELSKYAYVCMGECTSGYIEQDEPRDRIYLGKAKGEKLGEREAEKVVQGRASEAGRKPK